MNYYLNHDLEQKNLNTDDKTSAKSPRFNNDCGCRWVTIVKMVGDFSGILNLVGDRSPMTPMVVKPMLLSNKMYH